MKAQNIKINLQEVKNNYFEGTINSQDEVLDSVSAYIRSGNKGEYFYLNSLTHKNGEYPLCYGAFGVQYKDEGYFIAKRFKFEFRDLCFPVRGVFHLDNQNRRYVSIGLDEFTVNDLDNKFTEHCIVLQK